MLVKLFYSLQCYEREKEYGDFIKESISKPPPMQYRKQSQLVFGKNNSCQTNPISFSDRANGLMGERSSRCEIFTVVTFSWVVFL